MKTLISQIVLIVLSIQILNAQSDHSIDNLSCLSKDVKLDKSIIRSYLMTTDYYNYDLGSNFLRKR